MIEVKVIEGMSQEIGSSLQEALNKGWRIVRISSGFVDGQTGCHTYPGGYTVAVLRRGKRSWMNSLRQWMTGRGREKKPDEEVPKSLREMTESTVRRTTNFARQINRRPK